MILGLLLLKERCDKMGTSKGYIAPSTPNWKRAKREISHYLSNPTDVARKNVAAQYARAMAGDSYNVSQVTRAFAGAISFSSASTARGYAVALREIGREDILSLEPKEALDALISHFANDGSTIDDKIALDSMVETFKALEVIQLEDLQGIDTSRLLKEMVCQFAKLKFAQLFDKQIRTKCPVIEEANARIAEMQEYIYYAMNQQLTENILKEINPHNLANEMIVQNTLNKGFELMTIFYGE